ncbi:hypothetical protein BSL78_15664 [Apostichopus japonicus]|uniref:Uncharacterized protein n=1 Tax=Stichopus japonicus TaxID=307972 RepID=A0A2G8KHL6_STIJA|nr:hypothetical protein BSL78_15664 [Apostichopus japonicus]
MMIYKANVCKNVKRYPRPLYGQPGPLKVLLDCFWHKLDTKVQVKRFLYLTFLHAARTSTATTTDYATCFYRHMNGDTLGARHHSPSPSPYQSGHLGDQISTNQSSCHFPARKTLKMRSLPLTVRQMQEGLSPGNHRRSPSPSGTICLQGTTAVSKDTRHHRSESTTAGKKEAR